MGLASRSSGGASTFYAFDERGGVAQRLSGAGQVVSADLSDAYGKLLAGGSAADPWGFGAQAGYYADKETGLSLLTHRFYDPAQGRFLTRDPIDYDGGINLYGYVGNDPANESDPDGTQAVMAAPVAGAALALLIWYLLHNHHPISFPTFHFPPVTLSPPWSGPTTVPRQISPPPPIIQNRRGSKPVEKLRREWENLNGRKWPTDGNGKNEVCEHKVPLADGGADDGKNVEPLDKEVHKQLHKGRGDFKRWGARSGQARRED